MAAKVSLHRPALGQAAKASPSVSTLNRSHLVRTLAPSAVQPHLARKEQNLTSTVARVATQATEAKSEFYEVTLPKPLGVKFARGRDGGVYISSILKKGSLSDEFEVGDKVVKVSASFGGDVWDALNYGQVIYAIRTRNGEVYMMLKRNFGDTTMLEPEEMDEAERMWRQERGGGNYGAGTKEMQERNYTSRKEEERKRRELFDDALVKFRKGDVEGALIDFENVIGLEPKGFIGDDFARVTNVYRVAQYNVACCYSALDQLDAGLEALNSALAAGFEDFRKVRTDPNLANLRKSPDFLRIVERYDEPIINREAIEALKGIFSFGKKK